MQTSPPENGQYMLAAYIVVALIVGRYALRLLQKGWRETHRGS